MRVLLACPGLDHARRGFESFARECFEALHGEPGLEIELVKGSGRADVDERSIPTLRRDSASARLVGRVARRPPFVAEHGAFSLSLVPVLIRRRPDVVYFSEWHVGRVLARWRALARQRFKLVLCNGTSLPGPYDHLDLVQQLTPGALDWVLTRGADPARNVVLPLGLAIPNRLVPLSPTDRQVLRSRLELPVDRRIVISVGALNRQKRLDYLIEEMASMVHPRPFLLLVGDVEEGTSALRELARRRLGADGFSMRTVPRVEVDGLLDASDIFVLGSVWEAQPRALAEALARGLPCIAHAHPAMEFVLGDQGQTADLERRGVLRELVVATPDHEPGGRRALERHRSAYERFSWDSLRPRYLDLFQQAVDASR